MRLEAGTLVSDKVRLLHLLREGGMGQVWVGEHLTLETKVAVKFISAELARRTGNAAERFKREAKAAAKLKSPHVVTMLDYGVHGDGTAYMVMELLEGETLADRLAHAGKLPKNDACAIVAQVAKALDEAHEVGIVHRDIKPSNLFLLRGRAERAHGEIYVKVLDFGIAKAMDGSDPQQLTLTEGMVGTLSYMSPEQMTDARHVGPSADRWSLAVVAYHALTGKLPFEAASAVSMHRQIVAESYTPPSERLGRALPDVDAWFARAFAPDPETRFATAREMANALERASGADREPIVGAAAPASEASADLGTAEFLASVAVQPKPRTSESPSEPRTADGAIKPQDGPAPPRRAVPTAVMVVVAIVLGIGLLEWLQVARVRSLTELVHSRPAPTTVSPSQSDQPVSSALASEDEALDRNNGKSLRLTGGSVSATTAAATAPAPAPPGEQAPAYKVWPLGCIAQNRPCGIGCCMWNRGCEPGSCDDPLPGGEKWDVRLAVAAVWQGGDESKRKPLTDADVWLQIGKERKQVFIDRPTELTSADLAAPISAVVQPNAPWLPPIVELPPKGLAHGADRLVICRGLNLRGEQKGNTYWIWLSVEPAGEPDHELCSKVAHPK